MTETQQRFLRAIAERVPVDQIVELHLFPSIRQGGVETGVAVVAERPHEPAPALGDDAGAEEPGPEAADAPPVRLIVHTARYRLTLKGVDRGKWEVDVTAEADAPLDAVDAVVRGVQRRSGDDGAAPDRLATEALREALGAPVTALEG